MDTTLVHITEYTPLCTAEIKTKKERKKKFSFYITKLTYAVGLIKQYKNKYWAWTYNLEHM